MVDLLAMSEWVHAAVIRVCLDYGQSLVDAGRHDEAFELA